jgi:hypothetical protein
MVAPQQVWEIMKWSFIQGKADHGLDLQKVVVASYAKSCYDSI